MDDPPFATVATVTEPAPPTMKSAPATGFTAMRVVLGLLLLVAAALKGYELATEPLAEQGVFRSRWFLIALVESELVLGAWLVSGLFPRVVWWLSLGLFTAFGLVTLQKALAGAESCGCFGKIQISPWYTLVVDLAAITALVVWRPSRSLTCSAGLSSARLAVVCALVLATGVPAGWVMAGYKPAGIGDAGDIVGDSTFVVLEPATWLNKPFPLVQHIDTGKQLLHGNWLVVLYRHDCPHCQEALPYYERVASNTSASPNAQRVMLVAMPPYAQPNEDPVSANTRCMRGRLSDVKEWFVQTPAEIILADGQVIEAKEGAEH